jgi:hypothetical protein
MRPGANWLAAAPLLFWSGLAIAFDAKAPGAGPNTFGTPPAATELPHSQTRPAPTPDEIRILQQGQAAVVVLAEKRDFAAALELNKKLLSLAQEAIGLNSTLTANAALSLGSLYGKLLGEGRASPRADQFGRNSRGYLGLCSKSTANRPARQSVWPISVLTRDVDTPLAQLALEHFALPFEARVRLAVHSELTRWRERIDTWATIVIAEPASNALGLHVKTAFGPPALRAVDHFATRPTAKEAVAVIELADSPPT